MESSRDILFNQMVNPISKVLWTFGYGSLIWKPGFEYSERVVGYVKGYQRRFYQGTTTHRGTRRWPGRVATILKSDEEDIVWGVAYKVTDESKITEALEHLAEREMITGGYHFDKTTFYPMDTSISPVEMVVYIADPINSQFIGPASLEVQAYQIFKAEGVCGRNTEYVCRVADFMKDEVQSVDKTAKDQHLFDIVQLIVEFELKLRLPSSDTLKSVPVVVRQPSEDTQFSQLKSRDSA